MCMERISHFVCGGGEGGVCLSNFPVDQNTQGLSGVAARNLDTGKVQFHTVNYQLISE